MTTNLTAILGGSSGGSWKSQTFTTSGTWVKPEGVEVVKVVIAGGGGGGGYWNSPGGNGGNSIFYAPIPIIAQGGWGACRADFSAWNDYVINGWGGNGGGVSGGEVMLIHPSGIPLGSPPQLITVTNGGKTYQTPQGTTYKTHGGMGASSGSSISGAGGGAGARRGGAVPGFGDSGTSGPWGLGGTDQNEYGPGGGGGASFGNGGQGVGRISPTGTIEPSINGINGGGGGGGGYLIPSRNLVVSGPGGGGGEIVIREVPVNDVSTVFVAIGAGGSPASQTVSSWNGRSITAHAPSAGGSGICQIFWS